MTTRWHCAHAHARTTCVEPFRQNEVSYDIDLYEQGDGNVALAGVYMYVDVFVCLCICVFVYVPLWLSPAG